MRRLCGPNVCSHHQDRGFRRRPWGISHGPAAIPRDRTYFDAASDSPSAAWAAARRAVSIRNGEQDT